MVLLIVSRSSRDARPGEPPRGEEDLRATALTAHAPHAAYRANVVHRDIKRINIMYDSVSSRLKITDFGIARWMDATRTRTGVVLGTPSFNLPEQPEGKIVNGHTDLFAPDASLYELLTGQLPFRGTSMTELMFVITSEPHIALTAMRPARAPQIDALIVAAIAQPPLHRPASEAAARGAAAQLA